MHQLVAYCSAPVPPVEVRCSHFMCHTQLPCADQCEQSCMHVDASATQAVVCALQGRRALDFVLKNQGLIDKTLLFDIELMRINQ